MLRRPSPDNGEQRNSSKLGKRSASAVSISNKTVIKKRFDDGRVYTGRVQCGPEKLKGSPGPTWRIIYEDGDAEDLTREEIEPWLVQEGEPQSREHTEYMHIAQRSASVVSISNETVIKKRFDDGKVYTGRVQSGPEELEGSPGPTWRIIYEDGDAEDLTREEIEPWLVQGGEPEPRENTEDMYIGQRSANTEYMYIGQRSASAVSISNETVIKKRFDDGSVYIGRVQSGPEELEGSPGPTWRIIYEDGDAEDLTREEIEPWLVQEGEPQPQENAGNTEYIEAKKELCYIVGVTESEVVAVLNHMQPPYDVNAAMLRIQQNRKGEGTYTSETESEVMPHIGMKIRKLCHGITYNGQLSENAEMNVVEGKLVPTWKVIYDDGEWDDLTFHEVLQWRASRPLKPHPVRGRQLHSLELFSGCGIVSQAFAERQWGVCSVDNSPKSWPTQKVDLMDLQYKHIGGIPDFIWASPPCHTYSRLAGATHRKMSSNQFELSQESREQNHLFSKVAYILRCARAKNSNLIVVIENPVGLLQHMPLMKALKEDMDLKDVTVDYCTLGEDYKKPTMLFTNDHQLRALLKEFRCKEGTCPYYHGSGRCHPVSIRGHGQFFNSAAVPQRLANFIANYVDSKLFDQRVRYSKQATVSPAEEERFNNEIADA